MVVIVGKIYAHMHEGRKPQCAGAFGERDEKAYAGAMLITIANKVMGLRRAFGETQAEFARRFAVSQTTVSRWEQGSMPEPHQLAQLADMAGQSIRDFLGLTTTGPVVPMGDLIEVRGTVSAGKWAPDWQLPVEKRHSFIGSPAASNVKAPHRYGVAVEGRDMDLRYPPGTLLDCVDVKALRAPPGHGQRVIVVRTRPDGMKEATVRTLHLGDDGRRWLMAETSLPEHQAPQLLQDSGTEATEIVGLVVGSYRPE